MISTEYLLSLSMPSAKAHPDTLCLYQDHREEFPKSPRVLGPYLENNYSKLYSRTSSLLGGERGIASQRILPQTHMWNPSHYLKGKFEIISEDV